MSLKEKILVLKNSFIEKLPDYLAKIEVQYEKLAVAEKAEISDVLQELFLHLHSVKGGAATFGLSYLSESARVFEKKVSALNDGRKNNPDAIDLPEVYTSLREMMDDFTSAVKLAEAEKSRSDNLPLTVYGEQKTVEYSDSNKKLIYICDDVPETVEYLRIQLKYLGYIVKPFTSTNKLLEAVMHEFPSAIIMDIMFPSGFYSGPDVIKELRKKLEHSPPVIFISQRKDYASRYAAIEAGGSAYYVKPLKLFDLVQTLDKLTTVEESSPNKILIVDDEPIVAKFHAAILNEAKMTTQELYNPEEILETLASFKPDLILMDMHMPQYSGIDVVKIIRQIPEYISLPIIYLSSEMDLHKQAHALRVGAEGFLTKPVHPITLVNEVNVRVKRMRELHSLMIRDSLTGLYNHTFMQQYLEKAQANAMRTQKGCCVVMIDIDHFKKVNDTFGHQRGDEVIITVSRLLRQKVRSSDAVGRYGGEEFIMVLNQITGEEAVKVVESIRQDFSQVKFEHGDDVFKCTFSAGISSSEQYKNTAKLLELADQALYESKKNGRNQVTLALGEERL